MDVGPGVDLDESLLTEAEKKRNNHMGKKYKEDSFCVANDYLSDVERHETPGAKVKAKVKATRANKGG